MNISVFSRHLTILAFAILVLTGCDDADDTVDSSDVTTGQIYLDAHFTANGTDRTFVSVQLLEGGVTSDTQVKLDGADELWSSVDQPFVRDSVSDDLFGGLQEFAARHHRLRGVEEILFEFDFFFLGLIFNGDINYIAELPYDPDALDYYLSFLRRHGTDAPDSVVVLPQDFSLTAPLANETHSRANPIQINWEPSGSTDEVQLVASLSCVNGNTGRFSAQGLTDAGSHTIGGGVLNLTGVSGNCSTTIEITKSRLGTIDPKVGSGRIVGHQVRHVIFTTSN